MEEQLLFFASIIGVPAVIASTSFSLIFSLTTGITKKIIILAKSKLGIIEKLISQALIDLEISHEKYKSIIDEE